MIKTGTPMQGRVYLNTKAIKCDCEKCVHYSKKKHYCGTVCEWSPNREKCKYFADRKIYYK